MIPKTLSATAIQVAQACPARFQAEMMDKSKGLGGFGSAATLGSTVHGALEMFVKCVYIDKTHPNDKALLMDFLKMSYAKEFGTRDYDTMEFLEGVEMLDKWYRTTTFDGVRVISVEEKKNFMLPTSVGPIQFNYIWDRFDEIKPGVFKVVDYKSNRWNITADDLRDKIQARVYALACAIELKSAGVEYKRIWVEFDMLRHSKVGVVFSKDEIKATWQFLIDTAEDIIAIQDTDPATGERIVVEEKLNDQCLFCPRKTSCKALAKHIMIGGVLGKPVEEVIDLRAQMEFQKKGLDAAIKELDKRILAEAKERDMEEFESPTNKLEIGISSQRSVDPEMVEMAIGPKLFDKYGGKSFTMASVDKLLKGKELTDEQKKNLRSLIFNKKGNPSVKIKPKNPIEDD